jgi:hypothetical protein
MIATNPVKTSWILYDTNKNINKRASNYMGPTQPSDEWQFLITLKAS